MAKGATWSLIHMAFTLRSWSGFSGWTFCWVGSHSKRVAVIAVLARMRLNVAVTAPRASSRLRLKAMKYSGAGQVTW